MSPFTARETFDRQQNRLANEVLLLGSMVEIAIEQSLAALCQQDLAAARQIIEHDEIVNAKRYALENDCVALIATQQPMARDVRFLAAVLEIITELERIGDYAKGISKINLLLQKPIPPGVQADMKEMARLGLSMLRRALDAFVRQDSNSARRIPIEDDAVDALYNHIYHQATKGLIDHSIDPDHANYLMWAAHNLERMADRVTNICERTIYISTGEIHEMDRYQTISGQNEVR